MISNCNCSHEYQDKLYGKGKRVFNPMGVQGKSGFRCSVCGREDKSISPKELPVDKKKK